MRSLTIRLSKKETDRSKSWSSKSGSDRSGSEPSGSERRLRSTQSGPTWEDERKRPREYEHIGAEGVWAQAAEGKRIWGRARGLRVQHLGLQHLGRAMADMRVPHAKRANGSGERAAREAVDAVE